LFSYNKFGILKYYYMIGSRSSR